MEIIDVSVGISPGMLVFPGDPAVAILPHSRIAGGDAANVSGIRMGTHSGTHVDPPLHFFMDGTDVSKIPLQRLMGECYVADLRSLEEKITKEDLYPGRNSFRDKILLLKTRNSGLLVDVGVKLVGIDYLSIEKYGGSGEVHRTLLGGGIPIVETLDLSKVEEGEYFFHFLPLRITGGDGGPGMAVLINYPAASCGVSDPNGNKRRDKRDMGI